MQFILIPIIIGVVMLTVAAYTYAERKIIAKMQNRIGPTLGCHGCLQPFADILKLLSKEIIVPVKANKKLFIISPLFLLTISLSAWAVMPFTKGVVVADLNLGLLYIFAMLGLNIYGIIFAGWSSNSRYAFLGAMRAVAQILAYELAMGFALLGVVMYVGSMNLTAIIQAQRGGILFWHCWPLLPLTFIYFVCALAETNRAPFDVVECDTELVAGFNVEYSGVLFAMFFMAEYANMILVSFLTVIMFFGGWLAPFTGIHIIDKYFTLVPDIVWLVVKSLVFMFLFIWFRASFPRYRYDKICALGWKVFLPITLVFLMIESFFLKIGIL